jgi:ribosomal protein S18 acetylase RimI-like enzyme
MTKILNLRVSQISPEQTKALRHLVLWPHIEKEEDCVIDIDNRADAVHLATFEGDRIVSIGSLFHTDSSKIDFKRQYRLRAMATHPDYRGKNAGRALVEFALDLLKKQEVEVLWCDAREIAVGFYESIGFEKLPEKYDIPKIGLHYFMWKVI